MVHVTESRGPKDDERDALALAEQMRSGVAGDDGLQACGTVRSAAKPGQDARDDRARRGADAEPDQGTVPLPGCAHCGQGGLRDEGSRIWVAKLPTTAQSAERLLHAQYDAGNDVRIDAEKTLVEESHGHPITRVLETCPGVGPIRAAQIVSVVVTPDRFRKRQQFWSYCGLGLVMRSSSDWVKSDRVRLFWCSGAPQGLRRAGLA